MNEFWQPGPRLIEFDAREIAVRLIDVGQLARRVRNANHLRCDLGEPTKTRFAFAQDLFAAFAFTDVPLDLENRQRAKAFLAEMQFRLVAHALERVPNTFGSYVVAVIKTSSNTE
jgi:hypothetical protein